MDLDFTEDEIQRYSRHILLQEVGGLGQAKLKAARVLVVGAGGLGSPLMLYLAAAGIGTIGVIDDDVVDLSNLQRQVAHTTGRIGVSKVTSAAAAATAINPDLRIEAHPTRLTAGNALALIGSYDIVCDGTDNFGTRFLIADACALAKRTLVSAAVLRFEGQLSVFKPHEGGPCYRCLYPEPAAARHSAHLQRGRRPGRRHRRDGNPASDRGAKGKSSASATPCRGGSWSGTRWRPAFATSNCARDPACAFVRAERHHQGPQRARHPGRPGLCRLTRARRWASCSCPARTTGRTTRSWWRPARLALGRQVVLFATNQGCQALYRDWSGLSNAGRDEQIQTRGVAGLETLREACLDMDVRMIACEAGLRAEALDASLLLPNVEVAGIATFLSAIGAGQIITI